MRIPFMIIALLVLALLPSVSFAQTQTLCTIVMDARSGTVLVEEGACDTRAPAASTFKIPISLMGYDAGILKSLREPKLPFREGYPDWIASWRSETDPVKWMKQSVVWYSQQITTALGAERFARYVRDFDYGNADVSGDPGKDNGLTRSWLTSSLEISPREQVDFLRRMLRRELPVSRVAVEHTISLTAIGKQPGGWQAWGKTGSGPSRNAEDVKVSGQPWGWFVGWATKGDRTVVFARLTKAKSKPSGPSGPAARDALLRDLFAEPGRF